MSSWDCPKCDEVNPESKSACRRSSPHRRWAALGYEETAMKFSNQLALILSLIGVLLFGLCLVAGLGMGSTQLAPILAGAAFCFLLGASIVFWFAGDEEK